MNSNIYEDGIIKAKTKRNLRKKKVMLLISLVVVAIIVCIFFLVNSIYSQYNVIKYEDYKLYQYFSGIRYDYSGTVSIEHNNDISSLKSKEYDIDVGNIPIYYQEVNNQVLFPCNMELVLLKNKNKNYKIKYFTRLLVDTTNNQESAFVIDNNGRNVYIDQSFLYDGKDLYFFPYTATVIINKKEYVLTPLSYLTVEYNGTVEMYNKGEDKYVIIEKIDGDVIASTLNYKINLSTDMVMYENDNRLLIKNVDKLKSFY